MSVRESEREIEESEESPLRPQNKQLNIELSNETTTKPAETIALFLIHPIETLNKTNNNQTATDKTTKK